MKLAALGVGLAGVVAAAVLAGLLGLGQASWPRPTGMVALKLLVIAPLIEELFVRGVVHRWLLPRWGGVPGWGPISAANAVCAALFGLLHLVYAPVALALAVVLPALLIGWVFERTRALWPCVLLHSAMNGCWLLFLLVSARCIP